MNFKTCVGTLFLSYTHGVFMFHFRLRVSVIILSKDTGLDCFLHEPELLSGLDEESGSVKLSHAVEHLNGTGKLTERHHHQHRLTLK